MGRKNLVEFFRDYFDERSEYLEFDNGFRRWNYSYRETAQAARVFAARLKEAGVRRGEKVLLWTESRPEWVFAFWGSLLAGAVVVPVGAESSAEFVSKVARLARPRVIALGEDVHPESGVSGRMLRLSLEDWKRPAAIAGPSSATWHDLAEIVFTSGSTGEPKGVEITHGNLLSQLEAVESWLTRIRKFVRPWLPLRFLQLLPLSHMFGQATTLSLAPLLGASVAITRRQSPAALAELIRKRGICAAICVPRVFEALQALVLQRIPEAAAAEENKLTPAVRLWRYRRVHRLFGWRFLGFMLGGSALEPELERFWSGLGYFVVQGYGLTETSPVVSLNNPLHPREGSVGQLFPGVQARIARDGEILVRGPNVTSGYYNERQKTFEAIGDGWLHTGDLGDLDPEGYLYIRGRKKEMIATPEGMNVFPEDVERVLDKISGVRESAVVGLPPPENGRQEQVNAVLELAPGRDAHQVMAEANRRLETYQRIRDVFVWPEAVLPRTPQTGKLKRAEIRDRIAAERACQAPSHPAEASEGLSAADMVTREIERRIGRKAPVEAGLDELGLGSVDRVEMLLELEERTGRPIEESEFAKARTVGELQGLVKRVESSEELGAAISRSDFPAWNRNWLARAIRRANLGMWILPLARLLARPAVSGLENIEEVDGPVIFAANHESNLDGPLILAALPRRWRYRVAPAMYKEFFDPHFSRDNYPPARRIYSGIQYYLIALLGNAFPIPQEESGVREALRYAGELVSDDWSLLIFPEGERKPEGQHGGFQPGVGLLAARLEAPVIPVYLEGTGRILPPQRILPRPSRTRVIFGPAMRLEGGDYRDLARRVEQAVRRLARGAAISAQTMGVPHNG
jgi:long-chain acyl-CoA synthetase